ncbi:MAG: ABC transporter substrate-binding protein [Alphaproteobacteria bacterium]|nr:ABC transporter substrate-binding protein [Alphaproteobacteria bacterium]
MKYATMIAFMMLCASGSAIAAELKMMVTGSMATPLRRIAEDFASRNGHTVNVTVGITTTVSATIRAGEQPDLIEVTSVGMDQLARENLIRVDSRVEIARAVIGIAVKDGAPTPDISTPDALRRAFAGARSITYVNPRFAAQVGVNMMTFLQRLGAMDDVTKKAALALTGDEALEKVAKGEADMAIAFVSEILPIRGIKWLGPIPASLQVPTNYSAALGAGSAHPEAARALLEAIRGADGQRAIKEAGLEPVN